MDYEADTKSVDFSRVHPSPKPRFFAAVSVSFGSSVRKTIFTYQVVVFKRRGVTQRPLAAIIVLSAAVIVAKGGGGQWHDGHWSGGQRHALDQLSAGDLPNVHGARCTINPTDAKAQFPALSHRHRTLTYGNNIIEHVDFYSSVHPHHVVIRRRTQHAAQIQLGSIVAACCIALPSTAVWRRTARRTAMQ